MGFLYYILYFYIIPVLEGNSQLVDVKCWEKVLSLLIMRIKEKQQPWVGLLYIGDDALGLSALELKNLARARIILKECHCTPQSNRIFLLLPISRLSTLKICRDWRVGLGSKIWVIVNRRSWIHNFGLTKKKKKHFVDLKILSSMPI